MLDDIRHGAGLQQTPLLKPVELPFIEPRFQSNKQEHKFVFAIFTATMYISLQT
jgi:hypothetical protein